MGWRVSVAGLEHLPARGPAVLASNHVSYLDPLMVGLAVLRRQRAVRFLAKIELFANPLFAWLLRRTRQIPVDRRRHGHDAVAGACAALLAGDLVGVFPEGTISPTFVPGSGKTGAARAAMAVRAPLLPVAVWGGQQLLTKGRPRTLVRGVELRVRVGEPLDYDQAEDPHAVTERLMAALRALLEDSARD